MPIRITIERVSETNGQIIADPTEKYGLILPDSIQPGHVSTLVNETVDRIQEQN